MLAWVGTQAFTRSALLSILIFHLAGIMEKEDAYIFSSYYKLSAPITDQAPPCTLSHLILTTLVS